MPREYKYDIGQEAIGLGWECLDKVIEAEFAKGESKLKILENLSLSFDRLKLRLRMASEIGALSDGCYAHMQECHMNNIGKMIGGWKKWAG